MVAIGCAQDSFSVALSENIVEVILNKRLKGMLPDYKLCTITVGFVLRHVSYLIIN